jgi:HK97 family phage major capsid protein
MGAEQVGWAGEIANASDGTGDWSHVTLTPHRLTAYIDVSKQFLAQDALGAEALIRQELVNALNSKLEATILSADAATSVKPAGVFYGMTEKEVAAFSDITDLEADVEEANINGTMKYIVSPKAKAALRNMARSADSTRLVMEGNEVDGTPALSTTHMAQYNLAYGDWSNYIIAQWGNIDLTVDNVSLAANGQIRLVVNAYFDAKPLRAEAIKVATIDVD